VPAQPTDTGRKKTNKLVGSSKGTTIDIKEDIVLELQKYTEACSKGEVRTKNKA
jgi:hypothetical protein